MTTTRTATHEFHVEAFRDTDTYVVHYRSINPKNGKPWQATKYVTINADVAPRGYTARAFAYTTVEAAQAALALQIARFAK